MIYCPLFEREVHLHMNDDIGMYYCGKRIEAENHSYGPEIRNHYLFVLVNKGEATLYGEKEINFKEHDMIVMCPGERIHYRAHTPWTIQWIGLYGCAVDEYTKKLGICGKNPVFHVELYRDLEVVMEKIYNLSDTSSPSADFEKMSLIYKFFSILFECSGYKADKDYIKTAVSIIDYNFTNDITVQKLADNLGLNPSYLTRLFVSKIGISPKRYILKKRIEYAKTLLRSTNASIAEIAGTVGFDDQLYFSRVFRKEENTSPGEYRKCVL